MQHVKTEIDEAFFGRVYRTSAFLWAFGVLVCLAKLGWKAAAGWTVGSALSFGILRSLDWGIRRFFVPDNPGAQGQLGKLSIVKLFVLLAVLVGVVLLGGKSFAFIGAFCIGILLTQAVICFKVLGMALIRHSAND